MAPPGRRRQKQTPSPAAMLAGLAFLFSSTASAASAVLGVDMGTEYIKAALVKPGIPLEIVLSKDSKRKETSAVAFKPSKSGALPYGQYPERFYGGDAMALQGRFPGEVYPNLKHLLGVPADSTQAKAFGRRYPALELSATNGRNTVSFASAVFAGEPDKAWSVEELLAMELKNVRENARTLAGPGFDVTDVVFTVPPYYTVEERRALEVAARLAGLKVLSVVSDGMAVGINYATSRTFPVVNEGGKPEINLVFDMGAGSAGATVLQFQGRTVKDVGKRNKTIQEVNLLGAGWDRTLGGDALNELIVEDMLKTFLETPAAQSAAITADKVSTHGRTAAKLFKEAEKVRQVLSANSGTSAFFESLYDDIDLRYKLERSRYEELTASLAERIDGTINQALEAAGLTFADIDSVIVHGGATRTPFVQSRLEALAGKGKIRANVNSDEAAVFGAAFKAAGLSPSFRVKEIRDADTQGYEHGIQYMFNLKEHDQRIFTPATKLGITKDLPFQMMGEFEFTSYQSVPGADGQMTKEPTLRFKSANMTATVTKMIDTDGCDRDSFRNFVQMRLSPVTGTPEVTSAWVTCEAVDDTKGGIVDGVKNLFGMGGKKDQEPLAEEASEEASTESPSSSSSTESSASAEATDAAEKKKKVVRSNVAFDTKHLGYTKYPRKEFKKMQERLTSFDASDKSRRDRAEALNSLEAFTYRARDHIEDESFIACSTDTLRSTLESTLESTSEWMDSHGADATEATLREKLTELEGLVNPVLTRRREGWKRPAAVTALEETITGMKEVMELVESQIKAQEAYASKSAASASATPSPSDDADADPEDATDEAEETEDEPVPTIYTASDLTRLSTQTEKSRTWLADTLASQSKLAEHQDPVLRVTDLEKEKKTLDDLVLEMMMKKMKHFKPPGSGSGKGKKTGGKKAGNGKKAGSKDKKAKKEEADKARKQAEVFKSFPEGHRPSEAEIREAMDKAGVEWETPVKDGDKEGEGKKHDEL